MVHRRRRCALQRLRGGGFRRKLLLLLVLLVAVIGLLPIIVAKTPLRNVLISMVVPRDTLRVSIGDASFNWISGPSLSHVEVKDAAGETLLAAESIRIDRAPAGLAMNWHELGTIQIVRPVVYLKVRPDGSNLEDVIQKLAGTTSAAAEDAAPATTAEPAPEVAAKPASGAVAKPVAYSVRLDGGTIVTDDVATGRQWRVQNVNVQCDVRGSAVGVASLNGEIQVADRGAPALPAGRFAISLKPGDGGREQLVFQADQVALAMAEPWLRRFAAGSELSGSLSGQGTAAWTISNSPFPNDLATSGSLAIDRLDAAAPALGGDRIRLARTELPWRLVAQPSGLAIEDLQLRGDVGQFIVKGRLDPAIASGDASVSSIIGGHHDIEVHGSVDVAKLATMLPHVLRIRSGTTITSGTIDVSGSVKPTADGQAITGSVSAAQLAGTNGGKAHEVGSARERQLCNSSRQRVVDCPRFIAMRFEVFARRGGRHDSTACREREF